MPDVLQVLLASAGAIVVLMLAVWSLSVLRDDASIVDIVWGPGFVVVAWVSALVGDGSGPRKVLIVALATAWGLRLGVHLFVRNHGKGEDFRYRAMRRAHPDTFGRWTLVNVFGLQGALMFVVSFPVQMAQVHGGSSDLGVVDFLGAAIWLIGIGFEAVGDWQLRAFKADPANQGLVMDRGLWRYTRHPNYFGDSVAWWGMFLVAAANPVMVWTAVGPLAMTFFLTRVSGVPMLERAMARRKPGYEAYMRRTSSFIPLPPRRPPKNTPAGM